MFYKVGGLRKEKYLEILHNNLFTTASSLGLDEFAVLEDPHPAHTSRLVKGWYSDNNINYFCIQGSSPDLNPIETLFFHFKKRIYKDIRRYSRVRELKRAIIREWESLRNDQIIRSLTDSYRTRLEEIIRRRNGFNTKY